MQSHPHYWSLGLSTLTVSTLCGSPSLAFLYRKKVLGMHMVLSINNSPTFQHSKEHILLNIDHEDKSPLFFTGANSGCSPAHPSVALVILGLSQGSASHCKDFRAGAPTSSIQPEILASQLQSPLSRGPRHCSVAPRRAFR